MLADLISLSSVQDPTLLPAHALIGLLREHKIGSEELLKLFFDRVDALNPAINAVVVQDRGRAVAAAREADRRLAAGETGTLLGLPMTVKETFAAQSLPTTCGLPFLADNIATEDAVAVGRLRRAGAVIFGKTNVPMAGADHQSANPIYGMTRNPWALDRTPGGSSGGAAAALAARLTPLELGSDIGGSIRIPAHFCGVFGHKASYGAIPTLGHVPPMPGTMTEPELAVAGPLARTATDLELAMEILVGATGLLPGRHERLSEFRVAIWTGDLPYAASAETRAAIDMLAADLRAAGATVSETARPDFDPQQSLDIYLHSLFSVVLAGQPFRLSPQERATLPADALHYGEVLEACSATTPERWRELATLRRGLKDRWRDFFRDWDVLVCPVFPTTAFAHDHSGEGLGAQLHRRRQVDDQDVVYMSQLSWPSLATVADLPATVVPMPRVPGALPLGLQLIGPHGEDRTPIRLAALLERTVGYAAALPPLASNS